jgi:hypothetical protein
MTKVHVLSHLLKIKPTQMQYMQNMFPKVGLLEETKGRGKDGKNY